mmetsp:Transcript_14393/g.21575  ORF Transcript_14393/g.21575 Transcript_14393/m.21575 type:complete len:329 (+) Transcript_14393:62-1048(+)|eukprot:CAMPEP_0185018436 /NCGR_PEP_ID=MMETSP1103-20130426/1161_1 /TAXON_ID=36769 /ORGANISM="Paraphysomonas bandaiensis, Strain Caron Lab Isolate" /LENGTH=328 /DNA_ID=CAMNT_0027548249 /DNA_START=53 /DNA_END=1039 /DNA_ORIENTATION=+
MYTSRDAYNGCLTLFSQEDRIHRGHIIPRVEHKYNPNPIDRMREVKSRIQDHKHYLQELKKQDALRLPMVMMETVEDIIVDAVLYDDVMQCFDTLPEMNSKIIIKTDTQNIENFYEAFPHIDKSVLLNIWRIHMSFGTCYEVMRSLISSHRTNIAFTFSIDSMYWPPLQPQMKLSIAGFPRPLTPSSSCSWTHIGDDKSSQSDNDDTWEIISESLSVASDTTLPTFSYKDALLSMPNEDFAIDDMQNSSEPCKMVELSLHNDVVSTENPAKNLLYDDYDEESYEDFLYHSTGYGEPVACALRVRYVHVKASHARKKRTNTKYYRKHCK